MRRNVVTWFKLQSPPTVRVSAVGFLIPLSSMIDCIAIVLFSELMHGVVGDVVFWLFRAALRWCRWWVLP